MKLYFLIFFEIFSLTSSLVAGCTSKNTVLLEANYLNTNAIPISLILETWGKPNFMNYNDDGSSEMEWYNIEPTSLNGYPLLPSEKQESLSQKTTESLRCSVRFYVNYSGKADSHALICYSVPENKDIMISKK